MVDKETFDALCRQKLNVYAARSIREIEPSIDYKHNWHIDCVSEHLQAVWDKEIKRIIINIPPRTLKTHLSSISFPTWGFIHDPSVKFMLTSFKFELAKKMTRKSRMIMNSSWYQNLAPHVRLSPDQNEKHYFETTGKGHYYSAAMSSVTGEGADIIICDDPLNPDEAASQVQRQNCIETMRGTLFSRFNDEENGRFILIMQRLNADDPTGELLKDDGWYHLKLPAEAINKSYSYSLGGKKWELNEGELLFPDRLSREVLDRKLKEMGSYAYSGQMLQEPTPIGGGMFKSDWINWYASREFDTKPCNLYILVDPSTGDDNAVKNDLDYTAMAVWALAPDQNYYLVDGVKDRLNPTERVNKLFELHRKWLTKSGKPPKVGYETIGFKSDKHFIEQKMIEDNYRFSLTELPKKGERRLHKTKKIERMVPIFEGGRVWLPNDLFYMDEKNLQRNLISDIIEQEFLLFPFAPHDDFMDAMSMIFDVDPIFPQIGQTHTAGVNWGGSVFDI